MRGRIIVIDLEQEVEVKWMAGIKDRYVSLGYTFTKYRDKFSVKVKDLTLGSSKKVVVNCDICGKENLVKYQDYNKITKNGTEKYRCLTCAGIETHVVDRVDWEDVVKAFEDKGYELISTKDEYKNNKSYLRFICKKHRENGIQKVKYNVLTKNENNCYSCWCEARQGKNSSCWKGGLSNFNDYIRDKLLVWKSDSMKSCDYKCVLTGDKFDNIHHLYGFNLILRDVVNEIGFELKDTTGDYTDDDLEVLVNRIILEHQKHPLGVCLRRDVHILFHSLYGAGDNTVDQFEEFKARYNSGEFNEILSCN